MVEVSIGGGCGLLFFLICIILLVVFFAHARNMILL